MQTLSDVGLGYIKLGQPAPTLSGGEAQRIKLSSELHKRATGNTIYVLDEPTTGLHFEDIRKLLGVLQRLVATGNTVLVIEHNLDVVKTADWIIDLGPEGGDMGGRLVAAGTPEHDRLIPRLPHGPVPRRGPRPSGGRRCRRGCIAACAPRLTMLARIPADVSKRLLILTCAAALLAGACSNLPEADVNFGSGKEFVPYVADHLDDAGLGNAVALDKDGVPYVSYFIFTARPCPGRDPHPHGRSARRSSRPGGDKPKDGAAVGSRAERRRVWTRGAAAQVIDSPTGIIVPYDPDTVDGLVGATPDNTNGTDIAIDANGGKHVVWAGRDGIWYATGTASFKGSATAIETWKPPLSHSGPLGRPSVTVNDSGQPLVAYAIDAPNGQDIRVATTNGTKWTTQTAATIPPCFGCRRSGPAPIAVDAGGPLVVYVDGAAGAVMALASRGPPGRPRRWRPESRRPACRWRWTRTERRGSPITPATEP